jgi:hypothetical protein
LLTFAQHDDHIPFIPRRYYAIMNVPADRGRGEHAHRREHGFCVCLAGGVTMALSDGKSTLSWRLDSPAKGLYIPPLHWRSVSEFSPGTVLLCLSSGTYDEADYIRDRAEFDRLASEP